MKQLVRVVAATDAAFGIGKGGQIPWHYPEDFKWFKSITADSIVVMGRKTYEDLITYTKGSVMLPSRVCLVLTSNVQGSTTPYTNVEFVSGLHDITAIWNRPEYASKELIFIGGEAVFSAGLNMADVVHITKIPVDHDCDRFFPSEKLTNLFNKFDTRPIGDNGLVVETYTRPYMDGHKCAPHP